MADIFALVGGETLLGREIRDLAESRHMDLRLVASEEGESGVLTEQAGEAAFLGKLAAGSLSGARAAFLAGTPVSTRKAIEVNEVPLIDLTYAAEEAPSARLRAPMLEPDGYELPPDAIHVIAHPAAIALALLLERIHSAAPIRRAVVHVFEPASERGTKGIDELQQQTVNLLSFKSLPKSTYDAQVSFNMLASYGEEAPFSLQDAELRIERHLATLLSMGPGVPMPSMRLIQAPVFHGHSFSIWAELDSHPGVEAIEPALSSGRIDVRGGDFEPPNNAGVAGQSGIAVGAVAIDRNHPDAVWFWAAADNLRLAAENAIEVAKGL